MLGVQPTDGKMKLGFTRDQLNGVDNIWLKEYTAVDALGASPVAQAVNKALDAARALDSVDGVVEAIANSKGSTYTEDQKKAVDAIAAEAAKGTSVADAKVKQQLLLPNIQLQKRKLIRKLRLLKLLRLLSML